MRIHPSRIIQVCIAPYYYYYGTLRPLKRDGGGEAGEEGEAPQTF